MADVAGESAVNQKVIRIATDEDIDALFDVRTSVTENAMTMQDLASVGVTPASVRDMLGSSSRAWAVDDDDQVAESLVSLLAQEGLTARRAASGKQALDVLATESFDVVLLDVRLPDIAGPEVYAQLLAQQPAQADRVVFVTGGLWRSESRLRLELPPQPLLSKPCTGTQLRDALHAVAVRPAA